MVSKWKRAGAALSFAFFAAAMPALAQEKPPTDPADYEFRVNRIVRLTGDVNRASAVGVIQRLQYLDENNPDGKDITLVLNSPGGDVEQGLAIYDTMRNLKSDVRTVCEGRAMSMAAVLLAAGTAGKRSSLPNCRIMLHQVSASNSGKISDMAVQVQEFAKLNEILMDVLSRHMNRDKADVSRALIQDYFINAVEAKELGVIDAVLDSPRPALPIGTRSMPAPAR